MADQSFYTYLWLRTSGTPYYVGKGKGRRGFTSSQHTVHCPSSQERIVIQEHASEADALTAEIFLIAYYGRKDLGTGCLRNMTDGGEAPPSWAGKHHSEQTIEKIRSHRTGLQRPELKGRKHSEEHCRQISKGLTGKRLTEAHKARLAAAKIGTIGNRQGPLSEQHKASLRAAWVVRKQRTGAANVG